MKRNMPWVSATFVPGNSTGYCQPLDVGVSEVSNPVSEPCALKRLHSKPLTAIGGWVASVLTELKSQPRIRLNSWKQLICSSQADFDKTFASAEVAFHAKTLFRSNKKGLLPETDAVSVQLVDDGE
eukprot:2193479-Amphidinium_carterae.1